MQIFIADEKV